MSMNENSVDIKSEIEVKHEPLDSETEYVFAEPITNKVNKNTRRCSEELLSANVEDEEAEEVEEKYVKQEDEEDPQVIINGFGGIHTIKYEEDECPEESSNELELSVNLENIVQEQPRKTKRTLSAIGLPIRVLEDIEEPKKIIKAEEFDDSDEIVEINPLEATRKTRKTKSSNIGKKVNYQSLSKTREKSSSPQERLEEESQVREKSRVDHAFDLIKAVTSSRDECNTFGEHVANKLRKLDDRARAVIQHRISSMIFEEEIKMFTVASDCKET